MCQWLKISRQAFYQSKRRYTKTTGSKHWIKKHPNLLKYYNPSQANEVLVSDITYVESVEDIHYLSLVTDVYTRQIKEYKLSKNMNADNVVQAI